jgi:hypothetical protein
VAVRSLGCGRSTALGLFLLAGAATAWTQTLALTNADFAQVGSEGKPAGWTLSTWHGSLVPTVVAGTDPANPAVSIEFGQDAPVYTVSYHQSLPALPASPTIRVRFRYRARFAGERRTSVAISAGPGCGVPCSRVWFTAKRDDQWQEADIAISARLVNRSGSVLEFTFNDEFQAGDRFTLAQVSVAMEPLPALTLGFTDPVSGVVFSDRSEQWLRGTLQTGPAAVGRRASVELYRADAVEAAVAVQDCGVGEAQTGWAFDLGRWPPGRYRVVATLAAGNGTPPARQELTAWRVTPTDDTTRVLGGRVCQGSKPVLLFGTYHVCDNAVAATNRENRRLGLPLLDRDAMLAGLSSAGLSAGFFSWGIPTDEFLHAAARHGHLVIPETAGLGQEWGGRPLEEQIAPLAEDPRVFAWGGWDEPSETTLERAVQVYRGLKSASPQKLVVNTFHEPAVVDLLAGRAATADLMLVDIYDIRSPDADLSRVGMAVAQVAQYARRHGGGLAVGVTPQAFVFAGPEPTPEQLRVQIYLGLVNGAVAFFPYAYVEDYGERPFAGRGGQPDGMSRNPARQRWWLPDSALWQAFPGLSRELVELSPLILRGEPLPVTSESGPVQFLASRVDGEAFLIAANPQARADSGVFRFAQPVARLTPLFGTPPADAAGETVALLFAPYEVKVFKVVLAPGQASELPKP